ncbi:phosphopentomutase [Zongyangia hominis]|uniref:Phosphopentomutase n=1 Tax=Zongyangia hominis TaxID=2763677 RepID=A0A926IAS7_9FIRM|nr:phosphopentomutase [Zongyangia hominis]MBC8569417.1 phosphopentomutase [Zongyangia hominis]
MRVFLIVLDSMGIGEMPDAAAYGDAGSNTLGTIRRSEKFSTPHLRRLGLFSIDGVAPLKEEEPLTGAFARLGESSKGKDTTTGHWEMMGIISPKAMPTYPEGFPPEILAELERKWGRGILCNRPYSGTQVIRDYGEEHLRTGKLIVYTSADSVLQIAAHEDLIPVEELYEYCRTAREVMQGEHGVGRIIARPFTGKAPDFARTSRRHDFSLLPPRPTALDALKAAGKDVIAVGKINDIFAGQGVTEAIPTSGNDDGMRVTLDIARHRDFDGLCFVNLVDFDMLYGHRNDISGYAAALSSFDRQLRELLPLLSGEDLLMITADHGCDPGTDSTDHSREYVPLLLFGERVKPGVNLGTRETFADIGKTVLDALGVQNDQPGVSLWERVRR